ncbi:hypothetical protein DFA_02654 [Cavenderia fasciculata]|uniref:Uncharacterized protein n=1 Tax=Cavenderia fasciculata TaxID=261658 RepID=F4Q000_CACFS|nr:uncharacterized protein DFA_02654 [Cavenderia fasciculata]EGG18914.1 hypothetical protein DFA_02654 [Cavenderia fasciculata]|eukprot:XP_004357376.1 hypothetical protein DFA_02654 [Cavenderia fasciculata]
MTLKVGLYKQINRLSNNIFLRHGIPPWAACDCNREKNCQTCRSIDNHRKREIEFFANIEHNSSKKDHSKKDGTFELVDSQSLSISQQGFCSISSARLELSPGCNIQFSMNRIKDGITYRIDNTEGIARELNTCAKWTKDLLRDMDKNLGSKVFNRVLANQELSRLFLLDDVWKILVERKDHAKSSNDDRNGLESRQVILQFDITVEFLKLLWFKQRGRCYYSGIMMLVKTDRPHHPLLLSIERLNPLFGYTLDNTVLICFCFNSCATVNTYKDILNRQQLAIINQQLEKFYQDPTLNQKQISDLEKLKKEMDRLEWLKLESVKKHSKPFIYTPQLIEQLVQKRKEKEERKQLNLASK